MRSSAWRPVLVALALLGACMPRTWAATALITGANSGIGLERGVMLPGLGVAAGFSRAVGPPRPQERRAVAPARPAVAPKPLAGLAVSRCDVNRCLTKRAPVQAAVTVAAVARLRSTQFGGGRYLH
jgi:NAD(P)-dependent dehydrogenase (short-subunit alcohol dehydrogenase family)